MKPAHLFSVGQTVHVVEPSQSHGRPPRRYDAKVAKIGRVWGTLEGGERFDLSDGHLDGKGYSSHGKVWERAEDYDRERLLKWAWSALLDGAASFRHNPPYTYSFNRVRQLCVELGIRLPEPPPF